MLKEILASRRQEVDKDKKKVALEELKSRIIDKIPIRSLAAALSQPGLGLIAEIKGSSPSKGQIRQIADPVEIAKIYERSGAAAVSVLTETNYFGGHIDYLTRVSSNVALPVLRKDFIFSDYQIYEAKAYGADAVLLMTAVVTDDRRLNELIDLAHQLGLEVLLESSEANELRRSLQTEADVLGINNRNFETLEVDINISLKLIKNLQTDKPVISESGIFNRQDVLRLENAGFNGILVGTALMASRDIEKKIHELMGC